MRLRLVSEVVNAQMLSSKRGALAEDSMELSKAGNYADFILYARSWFQRERLIACDPRPGIADVRLIDPKRRALQKQSKKVLFVIQSITRPSCAALVTASVRLSALSLVRMAET
jgi:hypothetical protein